MTNLDLEANIQQALDEAYQESSKIVEWGGSLWERARGEVKPRMHQLIRIHEAVRNRRKRILCADTTSAGKTLTAVAIKGLLDQENLKKKGRNAKALVIAPKQAIGSAWTAKSPWMGDENELVDEINRYARHLGLPHQNPVVVGPNNLDKILKYDFILVNYGKFSLTDTDEKENPYLSAIMPLLPQIDLVIVDECHNLKNIYANRARAFKELIERTKDKNFVMLSASPIPNRLRDAGFLLYMLDPDRYSHYANNPFVYAEDRYSIKNTMNSGAWFSLTREDIKDLFNLPELRFGVPNLGIENPHKFQISDDDARRYFEAWQQDTNNVSKIAPLSRVLLESEFSEIESLCEKILETEPNAQFSIYSFYKTGFSNELRARLDPLFDGKVAAITGDISVNERLEKAAQFSKGDLRAIINTIQTVSESISLITYDRPVYLIFAEPPYVPANYDQAIGRFYRKGQEAPVTVIEMIPQSTILNQWMQVEKDQRETQGIRYRKSWRPGTIFEDKHLIRKDKMVAFNRVNRANAIDDLIEIVDLAEGSENEKAFRTLPQKPETTENTNKRFNEGLKRVRRFIGYPVERLRDSTVRSHLVDSYASEDWETTSSADTNKAITEAITAIEEETGRSLGSILDWGCGTACLARILRRPIQNLDAIDDMIEIGKEKCRELAIYNPATIDDYFHVGNAKEMPFTDRQFAVVSSSYAIQYNAQGYEHRRDIEKILLETNRVLKDQGYGILALANQVTTPEDIEAFTNVLLPRYGFNVIYKNYITGHAINPDSGREKKVFQGFFLLVYQKTEDKNELQGGDGTFIFSPYKKLGIGGLKEVKFEQACAKTGYKRDKIPASTFKTSDHSPLSDGIKEAIRNGEDHQNGN